MIELIRFTNVQVNEKEGFQRPYVWKLALPLVLLVLMVVVLVPTGTAVGTWTVVVTLQEAHSITDCDTVVCNSDDMYWLASLEPTIGIGGPSSCNFFAQHQDNTADIFPEWICTVTVTGGNDTTVQIVSELWEHDTTSADDHFDIHPHPGEQDVIMSFRPATQELTIENVAGWNTYRCSTGPVRLRGLNGGDQAEVVLNVSASLAGWPISDSDNDGLDDNIETCGLDVDGDGSVDVDLPALGADPYHKDAFVETDWMVGSDHSHEPWLPSMMNAWHEFDMAWTTNPDGSNGVALHLDTGTLYSNYEVDFNGDGTPEITVGSNGNVDMNGDGIPDIGNLSLLGVGTPGGGNQLAEQTTISYFGSGTDFDAIKSANFNPMRAGIFRYAVFADRIPGGRSGVARNCPGEPTCDDFIVSLGLWPRQRLDTDLNGVPEGSSPFLLGPAGLPVNGRINEHTGTFLHELGHSFGLGHGGSDSINRKPNYLSVMSYFWQSSGILFDYDGDLLGDSVGIDFNHDTVPDTSRFLYSTIALPALDETNLNEPDGINDGFALTRYGPYYDLNNNGSCDAAVNEPCRIWGRSNTPIDWSRGDHNLPPNVVNGVLDDDLQVGGLTSPPYQPNLPTDINDDGICVKRGSDGILQTIPTGDDFIAGNRIRTGLNRTCDTLANPASDDGQVHPVGWIEPEPLVGYNDHLHIQNGGLDLPNPGISLEEQEELDREIMRIKTLPDQTFMSDRCLGSVERLTFEEYTPGTIISNQYGPLVTFVNDGLRQPTIAGPSQRNGLPTQSPERSLVNVHPTNDPFALIIMFDPPVRMTGLYLGRVTPGNPSQDAALLSAYDEDGYLMGQVSRVPPEGITGFLGIASIRPDDLIAQIELKYEGGALGEPEHIDDLLLCHTAVSTEPPTIPLPPQFGDLPVTVNVAANVVSAGGTPEDEAGHLGLVHTPLTGVPISDPTGNHLTQFTFVEQEGATISLEAPQSFSTAGGDLVFDHWQMDDHVFFANGAAVTTMTVMADVTFTAVFTPLVNSCLLAVEIEHDLSDINPGDGVCESGEGCTLRAAVQEANATSGPCLITLPAGTYTLAIPGAGEDGAKTGDLDFLDELTILGAGRDATIVDGSQLDTVFHIMPGVNVDIFGLTINNGQGSGAPGGIHNLGAMNLGSCAITNNVATGANGGGASNGGQMTLTNCLVADNVAQWSGGGLYNNTGSLTVRYSTVSDNITQIYDGGGIANKGGSVILDQSTVNANSASGAGGGLSNNGNGMVAVVNSTIGENTAVAAGGGIYNNGGSATLNNVTVANNSATNGDGGGVYQGSGTFDFGNSILAGNVDEGGTTPECAGTLNSMGYNLIMDLILQPVVCVISGNTTGNITGQMPKLSPLAENDGATPTYALLANSPAIDAGNPTTPGSGNYACATNDQRGVSRPQQAACDMGAYESNPLSFSAAPTYKIYLPILLK